MDEVETVCHKLLFQASQVMPFILLQFADVVHTESEKSRTVLSSLTVYTQ